MSKTTLRAWWSGVFVYDAGDCDGVGIDHELQALHESIVPEAVLGIGQKFLQLVGLDTPRTETARRGM